MAARDGRWWFTMGSSPATGASSMVTFSANCFVAANIAAQCGNSTSASRVELSPPLLAALRSLDALLGRDLDVLDPLRSAIFPLGDPVGGRNFAP